MLSWKVYVSNCSSREIVLYNIFDHWSFYDSCVKAKKKFNNDRDSFEKEVCRNLMYFFWSKCEWEIILDHWPNGEWSELRQTMKVRETIDMYRSAGLKTESWRIIDNVMDNEITLQVYPEWYRYHERKIDVYEQVMNNWDIFIDYLWNHRSELKVRK